MAVVIPKMSTHGATLVLLLLWLWLCVSMCVGGYCVGPTLFLCPNQAKPENQSSQPGLSQSSPHRPACPSPTQPDQHTIGIHSIAVSIASTSGDEQIENCYSSARCLQLSFLCVYVYLLVFCEPEQTHTKRATWPLCVCLV